MATRTHAKAGTFVSKTAQQQDAIHFRDATAVLINSERLNRDIWFAFKDGWRAGDSNPVFYVSELKFLKTMSQATMHKVVAVKAAIAGSVIRGQNGEVEVE